jgi:hypothetical protein
MIAMFAVLGLAGWQIQGTARADSGHLVRTAYEDTVQRYHSGEAVQQSTAPQRVQPLADGANATGVDNARLTDAGDMVWVDNAKLADAGDMVGGNNAKLADAGDMSGIDNAKLTDAGDMVGVNNAKLADSGDMTGVDNAQRGRIA